MAMPIKTRSSFAKPGGSYTIVFYLSIFFDHSFSIHNFVYLIYAIYFFVINNRASARA